MTRKAHETLNEYITRSFVSNQSRVDEIINHDPKGEHTLSVRAIPLPKEEKGYMKVLNELECDELMYDAHLGLVEVVYARYDSETNIIQCTLKLKEGTMPPYLLDRALRPIEP